MAASKTKTKQATDIKSTAAPVGKAEVAAAPGAEKITPKASPTKAEATPKAKTKAKPKATATAAAADSAEPKAAKPKATKAKTKAPARQATQQTFADADADQKPDAPADQVMSHEAKGEPTSKVTTLKEQPIVAAAKAQPTRSRGMGNATERGDLFFFYRPDVDDEAPRGLTDIRRLHIVLRPERGDVVRLLTVGRKTLPGSTGREANHWAFVDRVFTDADQLKEALSGTTYETATSGERHLPEARPAGEGVYALVRHGRDSALVYALELPEELGEVQEAFGIERQGRFVVSIKNPAIASPAGLGLEPEQQGTLPDELQDLFGARKWHPADPPSMLDHEGIEMILIGGRLDPHEDLGVELEPQPEDEEQAEVFRDLHLDRSERAMQPLFEGHWA